MRKALIAAVVAAALFAVGAFAASFAVVESEDIASGSDDVTECATHVDVDFDTDYDEVDNEWDVTGAEVRFYTDANGTAATLCEGFDATVVVEDVDETSILDQDTAEISAGGIAQVSFTDVVVGDVGRASVLVDGQTMIVDQTTTP